MVLEWAYGLVRQVGGVLLKRLDDELMEGREEGLRMVGFKERWVTTPFGKRSLAKMLLSASGGIEPQLYSNLAISFFHRARMISCHHQGLYLDSPPASRQPASQQRYY